MFKNKNNNFSNPQKGIILYYAVVITSLLLAIALGLGTILISQIRGLKGIGNSAIALFGADTGMERLLYYHTICQRAESCDSYSPFFNPLCLDQAHSAGTTTCIGLYYFSTTSLAGRFSLANLGYEIKATTTPVGGVTTTIFKSRGSYQGTHRAIQASFRR